MNVVLGHICALQKQKTVTVYFSSKHLSPWQRDTSRHHTFSKDAVASSGCQSRAIKSQHHAQDCPWRSSMLSY